jgi:hypothetical protein
MASVQGVLAIGFRREARSSRKAPEENNEAGSWSGVVVHQNDPIARFTGKEMLKRVVHIGHWEGFGNRCYRNAHTLTDLKAFGLMVTRKIGRGSILLLSGSRCSRAECKCSVSLTINPRNAANLTMQSGVFEVSSKICVWPRHRDSIHLL